ncbi:MAG: hypothetical protein CME65_06735 [Halobacteriovoraceae bacterium]|nr:hypothetical protein [Halobacteriovoraceae bacterium]|tara:strand:+ start:1829 stop:2221 length:393 start_codon:yes stop_codon:yes gene_type:complete
MSEKHSILLIEDEEDLAEILSFIFNNIGIETEVALTYNEATSKLSDNPYRIVLSDMRLPDGTGADLCKAYHHQSPFILYSGFSDISKKEALDLGALAILSKPLDIELLGSHMKTFLNGEIDENQLVARLA